MRGWGAVSRGNQEEEQKAPEEEEDAGTRASRLLGKRKAQRTVSLGIVLVGPLFLHSSEREVCRGKCHKGIHHVLVGKKELESLFLTSASRPTSPGSPRMGFALREHLHLCRLHKQHLLSGHKKSTQTDVLGWWEAGRRSSSVGCRSQLGLCFQAGEC